MPTLSFSALTVASPIESTYSYLYDWAASHVQNDTPYVLEVPYQSEGRGQQGNSWHSSPNCNLLPSFLLYPPDNTALHGWLYSELAALAVVEAVAPWVPDEQSLYIKWPNDIYYLDKKLAGILVGHAFQGGKIAYTIVGIGLNVNECCFPAEIPNPISLSQIIGHELPLETVRQQLYHTAAVRFAQALSPEEYTSVVHQAYLQRLYRKDKQAEYRWLESGQLFRGIIRNVCTTGHLEVEVEGKLHRVSFKEIAYEL